MKIPKRVIESRAFGLSKTLAWLYLLILIANFLVGSRKLGRLGLETYSLYFSLPLFSFLGGIMVWLYLEGSKYHLLAIIANPFFFLSLTEGLIQSLKIPVLYQHFLEGSPLLGHRAFSLFWPVSIFNIFIGIGVGMAGELIAGVAKSMIEKYLRKKG